jgi:hypothetical protein
MGESLTERQVNLLSHCALDLPRYIAAGGNTSSQLPGPMLSNGRNGSVSVFPQGPLSAGRSLHSKRTRVLGERFKMGTSIWRPTPPPYAIAITCRSVC